MLYILKITLKN